MAAQTYLATPGSTTYGFGAQNRHADGQQCRPCRQCHRGVLTCISTAAMDGNGQAGQRPRSLEPDGEREQFADQHQLSLTTPPEANTQSVRQPRPIPTAARRLLAYWFRCGARRTSLVLARATSGDSTYHLSIHLRQRHAHGLAFSFTSRTESKGRANEGWGLDNVVVTSDFKPAVTPEPGSIALLVGMGVMGAGFLSRRRRK